MGKPVTLTLAIILLLAGGVAAEDIPPPGPSQELVLEAQRAVVFKDGFALVHKEGTARAGAEAEVWTEEVPNAAILGAFWGVPAAGSGRLVSMDAGVFRHRTARHAEVSAQSLVQILAMNLESKVTLELANGKYLTGTVRKVIGAGGREVVVIKGDQGDTAVWGASIQQIQIREPKLVREQAVTDERQAKRLTFKFEKGDESKKLSLLYFRPGIRWIPTYALEVPPGEDATEGRLILQAELLNEAEDLLDVPFDLVVGVPNFRFRDVVSPFVLEQALHRALQQVAPQLMGQMAISNNAYFGPRGGERYRDPPPPPGGGGGFSLPPDLEAKSSQDLFVYQLPKMTLKKGHRKAVPIFDAKVAVRHVYRWEVDVQRHDVLLTPSGKGNVSPLVVSGERVWHHLDLANPTDVPWTTGPVMVLQDGRPMSQDLLTYTPRGSSVRVPLTVAVDVRGSYEEEEIARELNAMTWGRNKYARVDLVGRFTVRNFKNVPIELEVISRVGGRAEQASDDGEIVVQPFRQGDWKQYRGDPAVNNSSAVRYHLKLEPGETKVATVRFHHFLRQ